MEEAQRQLAKIRKVGEEVLPNVFKIKDETGDATLYYGDLIPGVGRNGEPLYLMAQYHKLPAVPLKTPKFAPKGATKFKKDPVKALKFGKPSKDDGSGGDGSGGDGAGGGQHGGGKSVGGTGGGLAAPRVAITARRARAPAARSAPRAGSAAARSDRPARARGPSAARRRRAAARRRRARAPSTTAPGRRAARAARAPEAARRWRPRAPGRPPRGAPAA